MRRLTSKDLSLEQKARLLNGVGSWRTYNCGGMLPQIFMSDGPHGLRKQDQESLADVNKSNTATCFPAASTSSCSWNRESVAALAAAISTEAKAENVDIVLGPGINIKRSPLCGRNFEYFSEDPYLAGELAASYVSAIEGKGTGCCVKHFACNSQEKRRMTCNSVVDERAMHEIYLSAFETAVKKGHPSSIMSSYNCVNGKHAGANEYLLTDVLRRRWGFSGSVISDWGGAIDITKCIEAGLNLEMPDSLNSHTPEIIAAVKDGTMSMETLDAAADNILDLVYKFKGTEPSRRAPAADFEAQHNIAKNVALDSAVLLKHSGVLPVKKGEKILAIGDLAVNMRIQGGGSSHITHRALTSAIDALKSAGCDISWVRGYDASTVLPDTALEQEAVSAAADYNKILIFCGLTEQCESESYDRDDMTLPENQLSLIKQLTGLNKDTAFICFGGSPFSMPFYDAAGDILMMYLPGEACGEACAELITGAHTPCGKLSETWPFSAEDTPCAAFYSKGGLNALYAESIFTGYRFYESFKKPVRFEFGFGLSYTSFEYTSLKVTPLFPDSYEISWKVRNTGSVPGSEISQIYVLNPVGEKIRPVIELRGFEKCSLQPGEEKEMRTVLTERAFSIYDTDIHDFTVIPGKYTIAVAASVRDLRLKETITIGTPAETTSADKNMEYYASDFSAVRFAALFPDGKLPLINEPKKGSYSMYDDFETVCMASRFGRTVHKAIMTALPFNVKGGRKSPAFKMYALTINETPLYALTALSAGLLKPAVLKKLVEQANK